VAKAAMESGAARRHIDIPEYVDALIDRQGAGQALRSAIMNKARRGTSKRIVFTEGEDPRIIRAAAHVVDEGIGVPILLGRRDKIYETIMELGLRFQPETLDPYVNENLPEFQEALYELRQRKGINMARARTMLRNRNYFAPMMIKKGLADVYVSGLTYEYPDVLRPALQIFGTRPETRHVCGVYIIMIKRRVYLFSDTTVNIDPDSETLCEIAILAADFAKTLDLDPQVAMLSFSNFGSTPHPFSEKVSRAVNMVRELRPDINIDGEMQADTAVVEAIVEDRYPFSRVKDANVLIFPDLGSANIAYKLLARLTKVDAIGPVLLGVGAPVQVIQAGDDVDDIVALSAFAAVDAQSRESRGY
jgi:malate dehydrogenase (oxaloacetate-decarboxylating)(NADP+)